MTSTSAADERGPGRRRATWRGTDDPGPFGTAGRRGLGVALAITAVALALRLLTAGHGLLTVDEPTWIGRSHGFEKAVRTGHFDRATASYVKPLATRPGVTTMWVGTGARFTGRMLIKAGIADRPLFDASPFTAELSQIAMAVTSAVGIGVIVLLARRVIGLRAAAVAGVLLAAEPFVVAHNSVLHTDGLVALSSLAAFLALLHGLRLGVGDDPAGPPRVRTAVLTGVLAAVALLTKLNALLFAPGFGLAIALAWWLRARAPRNAGGAPPDRSGAHRAAAAARALLPFLAVAGVVLVVCFVLPYPALWTNPRTELHRMWLAIRLGDTPQLQFFRGRVTEDPGVGFYPVALVLRSSPWLALVALGSLVLAAAKSELRRVLVLTWAVPAIYLVAVSLAAKKFDRYVLPVLSFASLAGAVAAVWAWDAWVRPRLRSLRLRQAVAGGLAALVALPTVLLAPYTMAFYDPLLTGGRRVEKTLLVGWGEGLDVFGRRIARDNAGRCDQITVMVGFYTAQALFPCGSIRPLSQQYLAADHGVVYVVLYPLYTQRQVGGPELTRYVHEQGRKVMSLHLGGVDYGSLWRLPARSTATG